MIRKTFLAFVIFSLLVGCAPVASATPTAQPINPLSFATPASGAATVLPMPGKTSLPLRSQPKNGSVATGEVKPGEAGKVLGVDASGSWMLVEIKQKIGWLPIQYVDYTIAQ